MISEYNGGGLNSECLAYFYASWNSKCNLHIEALRRIDREQKDLSIVRINVSKFHEMKERFSVGKIPTFILLKDGNVISRVNGYTDQYSLSRWVKKFRS